MRLALVSIIVVNTLAAGCEQGYQPEVPATVTVEGQGPPGVAGADGRDGDDAELDTYWVQSQFALAGPGDGPLLQAGAQCDPGDEALSGNCVLDVQAGDQFAPPALQSFVTTPSGYDDLPDSFDCVWRAPALAAGLQQAVSYQARALCRSRQKGGGQ